MGNLTMMMEIAAALSVACILAALYFNDEGMAA